MKNKIFMVFLILILISVFMVSGAEKELSASVQIIGEAPPTNTENDYIELGTLKGSIENDLVSSNKQSLVQRVISKGTDAQLLSVKVENLPLVIVFSVFAMFIFISYIFLFTLKLRHQVIKKCHKKKRHLHVF